ncbi:MAG: ankyrin repeat domain-containing protein [Chitinispirillales bacterium]|jgi:ankyrin repeat protein|nr:ankyrin repeat domain-containing protein [Chitinispirillales bacterium]
MNLINACSSGKFADVKALMGEGGGDGAAEGGASIDVNGQGASGRTALLEAAWGGSADIVDFLLERGANPNIADKSGFTPLMRAVEGEYQSIAGALIKKGADVNCCGHVRGTTPLMLAAESGNQKLLSMLLGAGARVNDADRYEETAVARAYKAGQGKAAEFLESKGGRGKTERSAYYSHSDRDVSSVTVEALPQWSAASQDAMGVGRGSGHDFDD